MILILISSVWEGILPTNLVLPNIVYHQTSNPGKNQVRSLLMHGGTTPRLPQIPLS